MSKTIRIEEVMKLKGGENSHLDANLLVAVGEEGEPRRNPYYGEVDKGARARLPGWINIGDMSTCLRASIGLGDIYRDSDAPYIAVASKHTRPVVIAKGRTQLEAVTKAIAGDLNSPFGGVWGLNKPLDYETCRLLDRMFLEGIVTPYFESGTVDMLKDTSRVKAHRNRFLIETGPITLQDVDVFERRLQPVALGYFLEEDREPPFDVRRETVVVTGSEMDDGILDDISFAGNAAHYLTSNLVFYVHNGAIAGLGDGCGARVVAAEKARRMLETSAYAALSGNNNELWEAVLYDTPFTREDFEAIEMPLRLVAFSDAFYPKLDGFVETSGIDRTHIEFGSRRVEYEEDDEKRTFIPKRDNFDPNYDRGLIPEVVVQPGGSAGDKMIIPLAEQYGVRMAFTMTPEMYTEYQRTGKVTGRRFFNHTAMQ